MILNPREKQNRNADSSCCQWWYNFQSINDDMLVWCDYEVWCIWISISLDVWVIIIANNFRLHALPTQSISLHSQYKAGRKSIESNLNQCDFRSKTTLFAMRVYSYIGSVEQINLSNSSIVMVERRVIIFKW
jgi:hypothetical protein